MNNDTDISYLSFRTSTIGSETHTDIYHSNHKNSSSKYSLRSTPTYTKLNAPSSGNVDFSIENTTKMRLTSNGDILIGTTTEDNTYRLIVDGSSKITNDLDLGGTLTAESDKRIKDNFEVLSNSLEFVEFLHGYRYTRKDQEDKTKKHIGVIAQEVEQFYPELITTNDKTGIKSVNYNGLSAVLIECVRELRRENMELKEDIKMIKEKLNL